MKEINPLLSQSVLEIQKYSIFLDMPLTLLCYVMFGHTHGRPTEKLEQTLTFDLDLAMETTPA